MLFGQYNDIWKEVFAWIAANAKSLPDGEHEIRQRDVYANIHTVATMSEPEGVFEAHKKYIDLHYCITGGEIIKHSPIGALQEKTEYNAEKDYQLFLAGKQSSAYIMQPDSFAIFLPGELHMPKIQDGIHAEVKKVVVKIKASLL